MRLSTLLSSSSNAPSEKTVASQWEEMNTALPLELETFKENRRKETMGALVNHVKEAITMEKKFTACLVHMLVELKKLD